MPVVIDFRDYQKSGNQVKIYAADYERKILSQLSTSTKLLEVNPDTLEFIYTTGQSKYMPIKLQGHVAAARQYYISDTLIRPDSVLVYAPQHLLDTMHTVMTHSFNLPSIADTTTVQLALLPIKGAKFVPDEVGVTFAVDMYTEKTVEVPSTGVNFPYGLVVRTFPTLVQVTPQVGM